MTTEPHRPRIGIIGTGAIGGFYGLMLARAGFDVHFLLRSEFETVAREGLQVKSAVHGDLHLQPVQAYRSATDMPPCDWLLVGTKSTGNAALGPIIRQVARRMPKYCCCRTVWPLKINCGLCCLMACTYWAACALSA